MKNKNSRGFSVFEVLVIILFLIVLIFVGHTVLIHERNKSTIHQKSIWTKNTNSLPQSLAGCRAITANGYVYVIGGGNATSNSAKVYYAKLNPNGSVGSWATSTNSLPLATSDATTITANGYVYVIGGGNATSNSAKVYYAKLNPNGSVGSWATSTNSLPLATSDATTITANGYVYVIGGGNATSNSAKVYYAKLNPNGSVGEWTTSSKPLPKELDGARSITANGYVYVIGGDNSAGMSSNVYYAKLNTNGSTGSWATSTNSLPRAITNDTTVYARGNLYVLGGFTHLATVYYTKLNPNGSVGSWATSTNSLPQGTSDAASIFANGYVYVIGGFKNNKDNSTASIHYASLLKINS